MVLFLLIVTEVDRCFIHSQMFSGYFVNMMLLFQGYL